MLSIIPEIAWLYKGEILQSCEESFGKSTASMESYLEEGIAMD